MLPCQNGAANTDTPRAWATERIARGRRHQTPTELVQLQRRRRRWLPERAFLFAGDSGWRARLATAAAQAIYRQRASVAECVNARARNRGLVRLLVRGLRKGKAIALWYAIAHNVVCGLTLAGLVSSSWGGLLTCLLRQAGC